MKYESRWAGIIEFSLEIEGPLGERTKHLLAFIRNGSVYIQTGCFSGGRTEFLDALDKQYIHGSIPYRECIAALAVIDAHNTDLWNADKRFWDANKR